MHSSDKIGNPVLLIGGLLAITTGLATYYLTDAKAVLGFVAGLQVSLVSLQIEAILRYRDREAAITRQNRLVSDVERFDWMPDVVQRMAQSMHIVAERYPGTAVPLIARRLVEDCSAEMKRLELGHLLFDYENITMLVEQASRARVSIRATSVQEVDLRWWLSPLGRKYWQNTLGALDRGVHVERIFIYSEWTDELDRLAAEQVAAGVHVLRVARRDLPSRLRVDMIVWDEHCGYETRMNERGEGQRNFFTFQHEEILRMIKEYDSIFSCAVDLDGGNQRCELH